MRVVLDTNVVFSGFLWDGPPHDILVLARDRKIEVITSSPILDELERILQYPYSRKRLARTNGNAEKVIEEYKEFCRITIPFESDIVLIEADPTDDMVLCAAVSSASDFIITGDNHLLNIGMYKHIRIVTPSDFLKIIDTRK